MGKFLVRISVIFTAIYFLVCYIIAQIFGVDALDYWYTLLFELIVVVYSFSEGKYHCKYLKFTMLGIFLSDLITRLDYSFDILSVSQHNLIPIFAIAAGIFIGVLKAIQHYIRVRAIKRMINGTNL